MVKEILPKVEEIRQIKDEIPSYEEFLKNWKKDKRVQASYESEFNASDGLGKGYGPCFVCDLAKSNPRWTPLKVVCPADDCPDRYKDRQPTEWVHTGCWGDMEIAINGIIRCKRCYASDFIGDWDFACSAHQGEHLSTSYTAFKSAVKVSMDVGGAGEETGFLLYQFLKSPEHASKFRRQ